MSGNSKLNINNSNFNHLVSNSKFFDEDFYRKNNPEIGDGGDAVEYFLSNGSTQSYSTSKYFNLEWYVRENSDILSLDINPLVHFILFGYDEKRLFRYARISMDSLDFIDVEDRFNVFECYETIYDSRLFDIRYYLENNGDFDLEGLDPIVHYILKGAGLGFNPSSYFNTNEYLSGINKDELTVNPLYHFIKYGYDPKDSDYIKEIVGDNEVISKKYPNGTIKDILNHLKSKISIIIPIYNAYEETRNCIRSVLLNTHIDYELILINDCSTDERIDTLLSALKNISNIKIINNKTNQGFVKNVNLGMTIADGDVVLLNSDTIVTPRWLSGLVFSAYSDPAIATVTPFSNASDICVDALGKSKETTFLNKNAYQLSKINTNKFYESPTGNGFCLYIKRGAIDKLGLFDEVFKKGYGEETDFTQRAQKAGWKNIRNTNVFVYHRRHASFSDEKASVYKKENKKIIQQRHPDVYKLWDEFVKSDELTSNLQKIRNNVHPYRNGENILFVTDLKDGKPNVSPEFFRINKRYNCHILTLEENRISVYIYNGINKYIRILSKNISDINDFNDIRNFYFNMFVNLKYDLIYLKRFYYYRSYELPILSHFITMMDALEVPVVTEGPYYQNMDVLDVIGDKLNPSTALGDLIKKEESKLDFSDKKVVVYTAVSGKYDDIITPTVVEDDFDYICFTDNKDLKSDFWDIHYMEDLDLDSVRKARRYKILPHKYLKEYDYSFWIDGNFDIIGSLKDYVHKYSKNNKLLAIQHEEHTCIYTEAQKCIEFKKDKEDVILEQVDKYQKEGFPEDYGLVASGILFRSHNSPDVIELMESWYDEVINHSRRDQLSFNYACWKNNFTYDVSDIYYFKNQYFQRLGHNSNDNIENIVYSNHTKDIILDHLVCPTSIIIPIYNAYDETKKCLESVVKYTNQPYELVLINDCSTDKRIDDLLLEYSLLSNVRIINNITNQGFVRNINIAFKSTENDVVLLNSDTIVTPKWLEKIKTTAYSRGDIATVTPLSNNAGPFSVPLFNQNNDIDEELGINGMNNLVEKVSDNKPINTPTGNGFCMFIKRSPINSVGMFDLNFDRGYGEENDFCMRAINAGWTNVIDTSTYIYHDRNASFGDEKEKLIAENNTYLREKHPTYKSRVDKFLVDKNYENVRNKINDALNSDNRDEYTKKNILYVMHEGKGGTLYTSVDLMRHVSEEYNVYLLTASRRDMKLYKYNLDHVNDSFDDDAEFQKNLILLTKWNIKYKYSIREPSIPEFSQIYFNVLKILHIDLVHIRHLIRHTLDMPRIANILGIKVILSFHDFYYVCPAYNLIDDKGVYCGGECTPITSHDIEEGQCNITVGLDCPLLKEFVDTWRGYIHEVFSYSSEFITTSPSAHKIYTKYYDELKEKPFDIIEHGRDLKTPDEIDSHISKFNKDEPIRILLPGNITVNKGSTFITKLKEYDVDNKLELHFLGNVDGRCHLERYGTLHGTYKRSDFPSIVKDIKPHFIGIFSIWPETYCHTLSEAWSTAIPVLSFDIGALGDRIKENGGGFLLSQNVEDAYNEILRISNDNELYTKVAKQIPDIEFKSTKQMADEYMEIYKKYIQE